MTPKEIKELAEQKFPLPYPGSTKIQDVEENNNTRMRRLTWAEGFTACQEMDRWISVNDRLPEKRVNTVLAINMDAPKYNQHVFVADFFDQTKSWKTEHKIMGSVTHWQPLPEPPKQ